MTPGGEVKAGGWVSALLKDDGITVYDTYSTYGRGLDGLNGAYQLPRSRSQRGRAALDDGVVAPARRLRQALSRRGARSGRLNEATAEREAPAAA